MALSIEVKGILNQEKCVIKKLFINSEIKEELSYLKINNELKRSKNWLHKYNL
jgi:hypothetical protein